MRDTWKDLKYGMRTLVRNPGFTIAAVLSLALGIGANTAIFSIANVLLLRPLPVGEPDRLVTIHTGFEHGSEYSVTSWPDYLDVDRQADAFTGVAAYFYFPVSVKGSAPPEVVFGSTVSNNYFEVLGVEALLGRTFFTGESASQDDRPVAVLSHRLWSRGFASDPNVLGRSVLVNSYPFTVIGVVPEGFTSTTNWIEPGVWIPLSMAPHVLPVKFDIRARDQRWLRMIGRLHPDGSLTQAQTAVSTLAARLRSENPDFDSDVSFRVLEAARSRFLNVETTRGITVAVGLLMAVVGTVLLIACSNVTHLLLARSVGRVPEMALRLALGGSRPRIVRQLLTESVLLSLLAGVGGVLLAVWLLEMLLSLPRPPVPMPLTYELDIDWRVLGFTLLLSTLTGLLVGLAPALRIRGLDLQGSLQEQPSPFRTRTRRPGLQSGLVAGQIALSLVLMVSAGLCLKHLHNTISTDPGFEVRNGLIVDFNLAHGRYDETAGREFRQRLLEGVERLPGVRSASLAYHPPLIPYDTYSVSLDGYEPAKGENMTFYGDVVSSEYFSTLGIPIVQGRGIEERDRKETLPVVVVNETFARRFWPGADPLGRRVQTRDRWRRVIGVARDTKIRSVTEEPMPYIYLALSQHPTSMLSLLVRTHSDPQTVEALLGEEIRVLDPHLPFEMRRMAEHLRLTQFADFMVSEIVGAFALLALALSLVGLYGLMSYTVRHRTHEIGIRTALGADRKDIVRLVLRRGLATTLAGLALGLAGALAVSRLLAGLLYGIQSLEPMIFGGVSLAMAGVALLACYLPARRASRVDPLVALQHG